MISKNFQHNILKFKFVTDTADANKSQHQPLLLLLKPALKGQNVEPDLKMSVEKMVDV